MSERMHLHIPPADAPARDAATPRPWRTDPDCGHESILGPDGAFTADCAIFGWRINRNQQINQANARLIVCAVNAHDALVAALGDCLVGLEAYTKARGFYDDARVKAARAALALAEGAAP